MGTTENVQAWSTTAADNDDADAGINWAEGQDPATVNNSARGMMTAVRNYSLDTDGGLVAGGSANVITVTTNQALSSGHVAAGLTLAFRATATNTGATTFNPDSIGAVSIRNQYGLALAGGEIVSGGIYVVAYNADTSTWRLLNSSAPSLIAGGTVSSGATLDVDFSSWPTLRGWKFVLSGWLPATDGASLWIRLSTDGGSNFDASASDYAYQRTAYDNGGGAAGTAGDTANDEMVISGGIGSGSDEGLDGEIDILNPQSAAIGTRLRAELVTRSNLGTLTVYRSVGVALNNQNTDAIRFMFSSGNISAGNWAAYAIN